jgi:hypothetical protein
MYTGQVNRLTSELATLRSSLAGERKKFVAENAKAIKAVEALSKAKTSSQLTTKGRDVERHQKAAASLEEKCAAIDKRIAEKQRSLTTAQGHLDKAQRDQQKKDDRDADKRRKADVEHLRQMERAQRSSTQMPSGVVPRTLRAQPSVPNGAPAFSEPFDVCLSFAGEQRDYVKRIAADLTNAGLRVFYDQDAEIAPALWGRELSEVLDWVYREGSRFCLMFISEDYASKEWTKLERRSALARAMEQDDYLLPARFDDTQLPGFRPTISYVDLRQTAPAVLVEFVTSKLAE